MKLLPNGSPPRLPSSIVRYLLKRAPAKSARLSIGRLSPSRRYDVSRDQERWPDKATPRRPDVTDVGTPLLIGTVATEILAEEIGGDRAAMTAIGCLLVTALLQGFHAIFSHQPGHAIEVTLAKWSRFNVSFLADFPLGTEEIGYEEVAFFDRANCGCPEAG